MSFFVRPVASLLKLTLQLALVSRRIVASIVMGNWKMAGIWSRTFALLLHDDLLKVVVAFWRRVGFQPMLDRGIRRVLVVKLDRLGDVVNLTPSLEAIWRQCPDAEIDIVGERNSLGVLAGDPRIHQQFEYRSSLYFGGLANPLGPKKIRLMWSLFWRRYDLLVVSRGTFSFCFLALFGRAVATHFVSGEWVVKRNLRMLEPIWGPQPLFPTSLPTSVEVKPRDTPYVVIHAGASSLTKAWPADRYAELADLIWERLQLAVTFVGTPNERWLLDQVRETCRNDHEVRTDMNPANLVSYIRNARGVVGNDSGVSHIAGAVGIPLVVIWGPTELQVNRPYCKDDKLRILYHEMPCRVPCDEHRCHIEDHLSCLTRTSVASVLQALSEIIGQRSGRQDVPSSA